MERDSLSSPAYGDEKPAADFIRSVWMDALASVKRIGVIMAKTFFGFALADSMFSGNCRITRRVIDAETVKAMPEELTSCLNPSHQATIDAMHQRFGISVPIPEAPPKVSLEPGDSVIVMGVRGLPRLTDRHEYTEEEVASATFSFAEYTVE